MTLDQLKVHSLKNVPERFSGHDSMISIGRPSRRGRICQLPASIPRRTLTLGFWDAVPVSRRTLFDPRHVDLIRDFAKSHHPDATLHIHCYRGRSRSTAIALALLGPNQIDAFFAAYPRSRPNAWVLYCMDRSILDICFTAHRVKGYTGERTERVFRVEHAKGTL